MSRITTLQASTDTEEITTITSDVQTPPMVASSTRTITGRILPWGEHGRTSTGVYKFEAGAMKLPKDITRIKLLKGHLPEGIPVGHATAFESRDDGLYMTFQLGSSPEADAALQAAQEHVVDAFSIEAHGLQTNGTTVTDSLLTAVALVPVPAFANARVETISAAAATPTTSTEENNDMNKTRPGLLPGVIPGSMTAPAATEVRASFDDVVSSLGDIVRGDKSYADLSAALVDITDAGTIERVAPQWLGELWSGVTYERRIIPLLTSAPLKSRKAVGYRWKTKPGVDKYAGNKADIPSKPAALDPVETDSGRWAGGNDLDRAFWDFGETEFLAAYWRAMAESYAYETDREAGQFVVANAEAVSGTAESIIHAVARGAIKIDQDLHAPASFVLLNPSDYESILQMTELDAPKYLGLIPAADPSKWVTSEFVTPGQVVLGTKTAVTHYELSGSPLRVEAEHIAKGGRDAALFGYTALMLNRPEGLVKVSFDSDPASQG